jgi:hypothetical protein
VRRGGFGRVPMSSVDVEVSKRRGCPPSGSARGCLWFRSPPMKVGLDRDG